MADTNKGSIRYAVESSWGATPSGPAMTELRVTGESLSHQKQTVVSQEVRKDRMRADVLEVGQSAAGDINFELSYGSFEDFFESALASTVTSTLVTNASVTFAASTITLGAGGFTAFTVGRHIRIHGGGLAAAINGAVAKVESVNASVITITGTTLSVATGSAVINSRTLKNGVSEQSQLVEVAFTDVSAVKYFTGLEVNQMQLNVQSQQIVTGVFSLMGKRGFSASTSVASTVATANTNVPMTAAANVGDIKEGGTIVSAAIQSLTLSLAANLRARSGVGSKPPFSLGQGGVDVTGAINLYFATLGIYEKMLAHTSTSLTFRFTDTAGNVIVVTLPKIYIAGGDPNVTGIDADVFQQAQFTGAYDATTNCVVQLDFLPVTP